VHYPQRWILEGTDWSAGMLAVGATSPEDKLAPFSSSALEPSLVAPGRKILSTQVDGYDDADGTSLAAPMVTATAALVRSTNPDLSAPGVAGHLVDTAEHLEDVEPGSAGAGMVNPVAALERAAGPPPVTLRGLMNAPVPSLCEHPAGNLVNGELPGVPEMEGGVWLFAIGWPELRPAGGHPEERPWPPPPESLLAYGEDVLLAFGDITGDGHDEAIVTIACHRGGVSWPDTVHVYSRGLTHRGQLDLDRVYDPGGDHRERVEAIELSDDGMFTVTWLTHAAGETGANMSLRVRGTFAWRDNAIELLGDVEIIEDRRVTEASDMVPEDDVTGDGIPSEQWPSDAELCDFGFTKDPDTGIELNC
jgi:hypothetical protein